MTLNFFFTFIFFYSQIWLNLIVNDHQLGFITQKKNKKEKNLLVLCA